MSGKAAANNAVNMIATYIAAYKERFRNIINRELVQYLLKEDYNVLKYNCNMWHPIYL